MKCLFAVWNCIALPCPFFSYQLRMRNIGTFFSSYFPPDKEFPAHDGNCWTISCCKTNRKAPIDSKENWTRPWVSHWMGSSILSTSLSSVMQWQIKVFQKMLRSENHLFTPKSADSMPLPPFSLCDVVAISMSYLRSPRMAELQLASAGTASGVGFGLAHTIPGCKMLP